MLVIPAKKANLRMSNRYEMIMIKYLNSTTFVELYPNDTVKSLKENICSRLNFPIDSISFSDPALNTDTSLLSEFIRKKKSNNEYCIVDLVVRSDRKDIIRPLQSTQPVPPKQKPIQIPQKPQQLPPTPPSNNYTLPPQPPYSKPPPLIPHDQVTIAHQQDQQVPLLIPGLDSSQYKPPPPYVPPHRVNQYQPPQPPVNATPPAAPSNDPYDFDKKVQEVVGMGFSTEGAKRALRSCRFDINYAVNQLITEGDKGEDTAPVQPPPTPQNAEENARNAISEMRKQLTEEDRAAIARLVAKKYEEELVIQVYNACDKNEVAAEGLLSNM